MSRSAVTSAMFMRRALVVLIATLAAVGGASAQESPSLQSYDVELVIFRTLSSDATPEQWNMEAAAAGQRLDIPDEEPSPFDTSAAPPPTTTASFPALPSSRFKLTAIEEALRRSRNYQPVAHIGWTQPGYPRNAAKYLPIDSFVPASSGLMGQVALSRGRYLHLTLDLVYDSPGVEGAPPERVIIRQTRRMRSNERHYIDHPKFGVIAVITPAN